MPWTRERHRLCLFGYSPECAGRKWTFEAVDGVASQNEDAPGHFAPSDTTVTKVNDAADPVRVSPNCDAPSSARPSTTSTIPAIRTPSAIIQRDVDEQKEVGFLNLVNESQSNLQYSKRESGNPPTPLRWIWDAPVGATFSFCNTGWPSGGCIRQQPPERQLYAGAAADRGDRADLRRDHYRFVDNTGQLSGKLGKKADMGGQSIARSMAMDQEGS